MALAGWKPMFIMIVPAHPRIEINQINALGRVALSELSIMRFERANWRSNCG